MRLLYLRIFKKPDQNALAFFDQDINFDGRIQFYWDEKSKKVKWHLNQTYFSDLYGKHLGLTAIVGSNGVGKTTLLKFISYLLVRLNHGITDISVFDIYVWDCIVERDGKIEHYHKDYSFGHPWLEPEKKEELPVPATLLIKLIVFSKTAKSKPIYYSPHWELEERVSQFKSVIDISTDYLRTESISELSDKENQSETIVFRKSEIKRQLDFLSNTSAKVFSDLRTSFPFIKKEVNVDFNAFNIHDQLPILNKLSSSDKKVYKLLHDIFIKETTINNIEESKEAYDDKIQKRLTLWVQKRVIDLMFLFFATTPNEDLNHAKLIKLELEVFKNINDSVTINNFFEFVTLFDGNRKQFKNALNNLIEFVKGFSSINPEKGIALVSVNEAQKLIELENEMYLALPFKSKIPLFTYDWGGLSTGEKAYLNLFARINYAFNQLQTNSPALVYLLVDEPSTGFHPQWQKEYLSKLLVFLELRWPKIKKEIIISTHSPYLVSDLQKEDVVRLHKDDIVDIDIKENTFGANIHELLADSFYLKDGFMGDFARSKILSLINYLDPKDPINDNKWTKEKAKNFIGIIGEPLLKQDLMELYFSKYRGDIDDEIKRLQALKNEEL